MEIIRNIANDWIMLDPILAAGQAGVERDTGRVKIGDGVSYWNELEYTPFVAYTFENNTSNSSASVPTPEDFGAVGDGIADDSAAIQKLFNLRGNIAFTPNKTYNIGIKGIQIYSNTTLNAYGAKVIVESSTYDNSSYGFVIDDSQKNITLEGLNISSPRDQEGLLIDGTAPKYQKGFLCSNAAHLSIYQDVCNLVVRDYQSEGSMGAISFRAHVTENPNPRSNLLFENVWITNSSMPISGGHGANGILFNNIYIECADTTRKYHSVYLRTGMKNVRFNNFYIYQPREVGQPFSIYTLNKTAESCTYPIYLTNGEVHAGSLITTSNPYVAHLDNVKMINDNPDDFATGTFCTHTEQSFGYYNNCHFINCFQIRNGEFTNCYFKSKLDKASWFVHANGVATPPKTIPAVSADRTDEEWYEIAQNIERLVLRNCHIDTQHGNMFIYLFQGGNPETTYPFRIDIQNCLIEDTAGESDSAFGYLITQQAGKPIQHNYIINITDCNFKNKYNYDIFTALSSQEGTVDLTVKRCSFKSDKSFITTDDSGKITKKYLLCDLNDELI